MVGDPAEQVIPSVPSSPQQMVHELYSMVDHPSSLCRYSGCHAPTIVNVTRPTTGTNMATIVRRRSARKSWPRPGFSAFCCHMLSSALTCSPRATAAPEPGPAVPGPEPVRRGDSGQKKRTNRARNAIRPGAERRTANRSWPPASRRAGRRVPRRSRRTSGRSSAPRHAGRPATSRRSDRPRHPTPRPGRTGTGRRTR